MCQHCIHCILQIPGSSTRSSRLEQTSHRPAHLLQMKTHLRAAQDDLLSLPTVGNMYPQPPLVHPSYAQANFAKLADSSHTNCSMMVLTWNMLTLCNILFPLSLHLSFPPRSLLLQIPVLLLLLLFLLGQLHSLPHLFSPLSSPNLRTASNKRISKCFSPCKA